MDPSTTVYRPSYTLVKKYLMKKSSVDGGHRAVKYSRWSGVLPDVFEEGTHLMIPWLETPIIYDVRAKPRNITSLSGTKGNLLLEQKKDLL